MGFSDEKRIAIAILANADLPLDAFNQFAFQVFQAALQK